MQQQKLNTETESYELTANNAGQASKLVREGKANLEIVEYPWGVELTLASPSRSLQAQDSDKRLITKRAEDTQSSMQQTVAKRGVSVRCSNGKVTAVVRSSRVPVGLTQFTFVQSQYGLASSTNVRSVIFGNILDESQQRLLDEARRLAESSCLDLEVVDLAKVNLFQRAVLRLRHGQGLTSSQGLRLDLQSLSDIETAFNSSIR